MDSSNHVGLNVKTQTHAAASIARLKRKDHMIGKHGTRTGGSAMGKLKDLYVNIEHDKEEGEE